MPFPRIPDNEWSAISAKDKERGLLDAILTTLEALTHEVQTDYNRVAFKRNIITYIDMLWDEIERNRNKSEIEE